MPGCKDVGSPLQAGALTPGEEGFCDRLGIKTRGARHCYWGNCLAGVEAALGPWVPLTCWPERGQRRMEFLIQ